MRCDFGASPLRFPDLKCKALDERRFFLAEDILRQTGRYKKIFYSYPVDSEIEVNKLVGRKRLTPLLGLVLCYQNHDFYPQFFLFVLNYHVTNYLKL